MNIPKTRSENDQVELIVDFAELGRFVDELADQESTDIWQAIISRLENAKVSMEPTRYLEELLELMEEYENFIEQEQGFSELLAQRLDSIEMPASS